MFARIAVLAMAAAAAAQNTTLAMPHVTVPATCTSGFMAGSDEVIYTVPYNYSAVMSIIGSYQNLTWSGSPPGSVTLNGTDNTVGTARVYNIAGAHVIETILTYSKPANGPYNEVHNTALLNVPAANLSLYIQYDGTTVTSVCDGQASRFNFTAHFCANNATVGAATLHMLHMGDAVTVGKFLGGQNFTSCDAIGNSSSSTGSSGSSGGSGSSGTGTSGGSSSSTSAASAATSSVSTGSAGKYAAGIGAVVFAAAAFAM